MSCIWSTELAVYRRQGASGCVILLALGYVMGGRRCAIIYVLHSTSGAVILAAVLWVYWRKGAKYGGALGALDCECIGAGALRYSSSGSW